MKVVVGLMANIFTAYLLIAGIKNPDMIGFVKELDGRNIQPITCLIQIAGWIFMLGLYVISLIYIVYRIDKLKNNTI